MCELIDLRSRNEELQEQVAKLQVSTAPHGKLPHFGHEGLSWEERKRLLLMQLNAESSDETPEEQGVRIEMKDVIEVTQREIARRDEEIEELRRLVENQAETRNDLAVGAAAVAQMIESDELVRQEREKLREIQKSWEEKLRQAEIHLSMERAKLARERTQLEEKLKELETQHVPVEEPKDSTAASNSKERRWLLRLGLKEEKEK